MTSIIGNAIDYISYLNEKVVFDNFNETLLFLATKSDNANRAASTIYSIGTLLVIKNITGEFG